LFFGDCQQQKWENQGVAADHDLEVSDHAVDHRVVGHGRAEDHTLDLDPALLMIRMVVAYMLLIWTVVLISAT